MKAQALAIGVAAIVALGVSPVLADHNSVNEEGWANMPNDIHNERVRTLEEGDNEAFREFVKYGEGSETDNTLNTDNLTAKREKAQTGKSETEQAQTKAMEGTRENSRSQEQRRDRPESVSGSTMRDRAASQRGTTMRSDRDRRSSGQRSTGRRGGR